MKNAIEQLSIIMCTSETSSGRIDYISNRDGVEQLCINRDVSGACFWSDSESKTQESSHDVLEANIQPDTSKACFWPSDDPPMEQISA